MWFYLSETDRINRASLQLFQENKGILVFKVKSGTHIFSLKKKKRQFSNKNHPCLTIQLTCQYCFSPSGLKCQSTVARADTSSLFLQEIHFRENPSPATASVRESTSEHPPWHWETTEYSEDTVIQFSYKWKRFSDFQKCIFRQMDLQWLSTKLAY